MQWRAEIEENLEKMDVFVGLLTTAFLASGFIENVELKAARARLATEGKDFLFVLVLVDDISLDALDLAEYQILKPGGKAVSKHASRKEGFDVAQKELEHLILKRQASRKQQKRVDAAVQQSATTAQAKAGITILAQGDYIEKDKAVAYESSVQMRGNHGQIGQALTNSMTVIQRQAPGARKDALEELAKQVEQLIAALPVDKQDDASDVAESLDMLVKQATSATPNRKWYGVSKDGLLQAAALAKDSGGNVAGALKNLDRLVWPDGPA